MQEKSEKTKSLSTLSDKITEILPGCFFPIVTISLRNQGLGLSTYLANWPEKRAKWPIEF